MRPAVESGGCRTEIKCTKIGSGVTTFGVIAVAGSIFCLRSSQLAQVVCSLYSTLLNALLCPLPTAKKKNDRLTLQPVSDQHALAQHTDPGCCALLMCAHFRDYPRRHQRTGAHPPSW